MSNIKGGSFHSQIKNIIIRTKQIGTSKRENERSNQIHSYKTLEFRQSLLNDFKTYLENELNITDGKLNNHFSNEDIMRGFINNRVNNLSYNSSKTIISGMSGIISSLKETNVSINLPNNFFTNIKNEVKDIKYTPQSSKDIHKSFTNKELENVLNHLYRKSFEMGTLGSTMLNLGIRFNEGIKLLSNPSKYIDGNNIIGLKGKSGKVYLNKTISNDLKSKILSINKDNIPSLKTFNNNIKKGSGNNSKSSHSFRFTYTKLKYKELTTNNNTGGLSHKETMIYISRQLNHWRNTTPYYLNRI